MKMSGLLVAGVALGCIPGYAAGSGNAVDLFYIPSADFEVSDSIDSVSVDGDGFGAQGRFMVADQLFVGAEYQQVEMDDVPIEISQLRFRVIGALPLSAGVNLTLEGGYIDADIDIGVFSLSGDGPMGHVGVEFRPSETLTLFGKAGIVKVDDVDGPEFHLGVRAQVSEVIGLLADYRMTSLEESGEELELDDLRVGVSFLF